VVENFHGKLPKEPELLNKEIPGVGPYTAGAIASIAFGTHAAAVDGNVIRVLSRIRAIGSENLKSPSITNFIWDLAEKLVDEEKPGDFNQAMMELGATICKITSPGCNICPVQSLCKAYEEVSDIIKIHYV
jgi:A/G-specific adenine glycosylase